MSNKKSRQQDDTQPDIAPSEAPKAASVELVTVDNLSIRTGNRLKLNGHNPNNVKGVGPMHRCADTLHGWTEHKHHQSESMKLSEADYLAALKAAGNYETHTPAIAPHRRK